MNKAALIELISEKVGVSKRQSEDMLNLLIDTIIAKLQQNEEVTLTGFGTFSARKRASRMGVNPQKPTERIRIDDVIVPKFKAGKRLKDELKKPSNATPAPTDPTVMM